MKVTFIIKKSAKRYDTESLATIYLRMRDGRRLDSVMQTQLSINPNYWDDKNECVKTKVVCDEQMRMTINEELRKLRSFVEKIFAAEAAEVDKDWLKIAIDRYYNPSKYAVVEEEQFTFEQLFDEFLLKHDISEVRKKNFRVVKRAMMRYELFVRKAHRGKKDFVLDINTTTDQTLHDMWDFFAKEHEYFTKYPKLFESIPEKRRPEPRGKNTLIDCFSRMRTFFIWCYDNGYTKNKPFEKFPIEEPIYGTPIYISIEERDQIYNTDLSLRPQLAIQRDIFVFQSVIGCRISDLRRMTRANIVNGAIEYIQKKTKHDNPRTVRVPLNAKAKEILERYKDYDGNTLLPFISEQKYNQSIKECFRLAGVNRIVTILDPKTREEKKVPIYEVASSHMARRTFIGNIYRQVKDPNLVSSLSGHKEGSKAFQRYRDIDEEMKKDLVGLLD